jgi:hypothetical protein
MKNKLNPWAIAGFICAIAPNPIAAAACAFRGPQGGCFDLWPLDAIIYLFVGFSIIPGWTILLGIISIVLAIIGIRKRGAGGKLLAIAALILGTLDIVVAGILLAGRAYGLWA